jgi:hypothetical protein
MYLTARPVDLFAVVVRRALATRALPARAGPRLVAERGVAVLRSVRRALRPAAVFDVF